MRNLALAFIAFIAAVTVISCDDTETYAEQKDKERAAISRFIADSAITVITESQFKEQGYKTDVSKNEFVLMQNSGVYMQIVREGCGEKIKEGETTTVLCRFTEYNILTDSLQLTNDILSFSSIVDRNKQQRIVYSVVYRRTERHGHVLWHNVSSVRLACSVDLYKGWTS